jgi:hypothetical protein
MKQIFYSCCSEVDVEPCVAVEHFRETPEAAVSKKTTDCLELTFFYEGNSPSVSVSIDKNSAKEILSKIKAHLDVS